jgi:hypothetical protein
MEGVSGLLSVPALAIALRESQPTAGVLGT